MSSLWTPGGEHRVPSPDPDDATSARPGASGPGHPRGAPPAGGRPAAGGAADAHEAELQDQMEEVRRQLVQAPASAVVANHCYGLFELAALHLSQPGPDLDAARLAIDAMAALVEGLAGRLGDGEADMRDGLAQIRLAFVQVQAAAAAGRSEE